MTDSLSAVHRLIDERPMEQADEVYRSSNGDIWHLVREASTDRVLVRHTLNATSGSAVSEMSVDEFLAINGSGPEHGALRLLLQKSTAA